MLATSIQLGALPTFADDRLVDWIPVDYAAGTMLDIVTTSAVKEDIPGRSETYISIHNIVNPHPITWDACLTEVQFAVQGKTRRGFQSPLRQIPMSQWVTKLRGVIEQEFKTPAAQSDAEKKMNSDLGTRIPGSKLLNFFEELAASATATQDGDAVEKAPVTFSTHDTEKISSHLRDGKPVNKKLLELCFAWWDSKGLLDLELVY
jgi:hypothetical protein